MTHRLAALLSRYHRAGPAEQAQLKDDLLNLAAHRQQLLVSLIEDDPGEVLRLTLPKHLLAKVPAGLEEYIEQWIELEGVLEVFYECDEQTGRLRHFLNANGGPFPLHFKSHPPQVKTGARVRVNGMYIDGGMALESGDTSVEILALDGNGSGDDNTTTGAHLPNTVGEQRTLVLLVNFQDQLEEPWTLDEVYSLVFGTTSEFFLENSFDQTWLTGDVYGWFTLSIDRTCSRFELQPAADSAAAEAGVDLSAYTRYVYVFPRNTACGWSGKATVGGNPSRAYINGRLELKVLAHELGHNFGLYHSHALECGDTTLGTDCQNWEYGDTFDVMGNKNAGHLNPFQKERLGWLGEGASALISTIETDGTYVLEVYETAEGSEPKAVKILKDIAPTTGDKTWYYIEYRQNIGFDDFLEVYDNVYGNVLNGVVLREGSDADPNSSFLLDMTPNSVSYTYDDFGDPALEVGQSYSDPEAGMTVTAQWADGIHAALDVILTPPSCVFTNPTLEILPSESEWVEAGTPITYSVTVTNNDSTACAAAPFNLEAMVPDGWTAIFGEPSLTLEPAASASTTLEVISSPLAPDGFYTVEVTVQNSAEPGYAGYATVTYVVSSDAVNDPPVAVDDSAATLQGTPVIIDVLANDSDPENDLLTVCQVTQGSEGMAVINADSTVTYTPRSKTKGKDSFTYTVTDGHSNSIAKVSITLEKQQGNGGNNGGGKGKGRNP
jgi:hypothetical protein